MAAARERTATIEDREDLVEELFVNAARHAARLRTGAIEGQQRPAMSYREMVDAFDGPLPEVGASEYEVLDDLAATIAPGIHAMTGGRFFGWVIGASHPAGVAADFVTSAIGQNCGNHLASPGAAAVEAVAASWLLDLLHLPAECSVGFVTGATVANFTCLAAARGEVLARVGYDVEADGLFGAPPITVLIGSDAHTTVFAGLQLLGLGHDRVVAVPTDDQGRIDNDAFADAIARADGPLIAILQAGQINTGAFDDFAALVPMVHARGGWVHVDGAFGLWAQAAPETAALTAGVALADSWATDGHKWLQTPYDCGYAICRDQDAHRRAMTAAASYLPVAGEGDRDPSQFVPELSRRARGFATWAVIRHLGREGIARMVARHCALARRFAERLSGEPGVAVVNDVVLNQLIVRFAADRDAATGDDLTRRTIARIQADGELFAGGASWRGQEVMRLSVISFPTNEDDIDRSAAAVLAAWRAVAAKT